MIKLLWVGDAVATTGFARVTHSILDELQKSGEYDIHVLGINYNGDPHEYPYKIYPAFSGGDMFGVGRFPQLLSSIEPDVIFIVQDIWNIDAYLQKLGITIENTKVMPRLVIYFPLDAPGFKPGWATPLRAASRVCVYTQFAKDIVQPYTPTEIEIIPHGIDTSVFFPMADARQRLKSVDPAWDIIGNVN